MAFPIMGCTKNNKKALTKMVQAYIGGGLPR